MARRQNPKIERTLKRTSSLKLVKQTFLIVCEGEVTEPEYFNSFRLTSANVTLLGILRREEVETMINVGSYLTRMIFLTAILIPRYRWHRPMVFKWHIATKHLNTGFCYISTYIKAPYTEAATVRCLPICLVSDTVRQKGTP